MIVKNLGISKGTGLSDAGESRLLYSHEKKPKDPYISLYTELKMQYNACI